MTLESHPKLRAIRRSIICSMQQREETLREELRTGRRKAMLAARRDKSAKYSTLEPTNTHELEYIASHGVFLYLVVAGASICYVCFLDVVQ